jgi:hypothetical protein
VREAVLGLGFLENWLGASYILPPLLVGAVVTREITKMRRCQGLLALWIARLSPNCVSWLSMPESCPRPAQAVGFQGFPRSSSARKSLLLRTHGRWAGCARDAVAVAVAVEQDVCFRQAWYRGARGNPRMLFLPNT